MSGSIDLHAVRSLTFDEVTWTYSERDAILYALSVGCHATDDSRWTYENHESFAPLPTFAVLVIHQGALASVDLSSILPRFNPMLLLHGEQYLELCGPLPSCPGALTTTAKVLDVKDKGKGAVVVIQATSVDKETGQTVAINEVTSFIRGSGGFAQTPAVSRRPAAVAPNRPLQRPPDATMRERVSKDQAALYRLNGDYNPLHIDPEFAAGGGFDRPILHGLCTFGICCKHVLQQFAGSQSAAFKSMKGRFSGHVFPGETLVTEMWVASASTVVFQARVQERNTLALTNAAVTLHDSVNLQAAPQKAKL